MAVLLLAACARTPPEEKLRTAVAGMQAAIEQHDASTLRNVMADDFLGPDGLDRDGARRMATALFLRYRDVGASLGPLDIGLREPYATVRFAAILTGSAGTLPGNGQVYDVETEWRLEDGEWRMVNAGWKPRF